MLFLIRRGVKNKLPIKVFGKIKEVSSSKKMRLKMIVLIIIIFGFLYGRDYFLFHKKYGMEKSSIPMGIYILSFKWWNIKFNWYTRLNNWYIDISIVFPFGKYHREYILKISSTGIKLVLFR